MSARFRLVIASLSVVVPLTTVIAQARPPRAVIDGVVADTNLVAIADAAVSILDSRMRVVTNQNGRFRIQGLSAGRHVIVVSRVGYTPASTTLEIAENDTLRLSLTLDRVSRLLDTVAVEEKMLSPRLTEFEQHRRLGQGQFMTEEQIEQHNSVFAVDLLRTFTGVNGRTPWIGYRSGCPFQFFIDGVAVKLLKPESTLPSPKELAGIELYTSSASIPLQYKTISGGAFCGVVLLWTRG